MEGERPVTVEVGQGLFKPVPRPPLSTGAARAAPVLEGSINGERQGERRRFAFPCVGVGGFSMARCSGAMLVRTLPVKYGGAVPQASSS